MNGQSSSLVAMLRPPAREIMHARRLLARLVPFDEWARGRSAADIALRKSIVDRLQTIAGVSGLA